MNKNKLALIIPICLLGSMPLMGCENQMSSKVSKSTQSSEELVVDIMRDYGAHGDGVYTDRAIIQKAINEVSCKGGGTIVLTSGHTFLTGNLLLQSNVKLLLGDNTILLQNPNPGDYIEVRGYDYGKGFVKIGDHYTPYIDDVNLTKTGIYKDIWPGCNDYLEAWHWNYPFIYADKGTTNIVVSGGTNSEIRMATHGDDCNGNIHMNVFGYYRVTNFEVSNLLINYTGNHLMDYICCNNGVIKNLSCNTKRSIGISECRMNDGMHLDRCQDMLIEYCTFASGDDSFKIGNSYGDVRRDRWASSTDTQIMKNIEVSHVVTPGLCSGFALMSLCGTCPDISQVEMRDIYIHDCQFAGTKIWGQNSVWLPDYSMWNGIEMPIANVTWLRNNAYYAPEGYVHQLCGYFGFPDWISDLITDATEIKSMSSIKNGDFSLGTSYWNLKENNGSVATVERYNNKSYGFLNKLDKGIAQIYEGISLESGSYKLSCKVKKSSDAKAYIFVSDQNNNIVQKVDITNVEWESLTLDFDINEAGSYRLGMSSDNGSGVDSWAMIDDFMIKKV